jgi:hypothetical protein
VQTNVRSEVDIRFMVVSSEEDSRTRPRRSWIGKGVYQKNSEGWQAGERWDAVFEECETPPYPKSW